MVAELLVGLQQRCRINVVKTDEAVLCAFCNDLRRRQVGSIADYAVSDGRGLEFTGLVNCLIGHARRALSNPETEVTQDEWDLTVFGRERCHHRCAVRSAQLTATGVVPMSFARRPVSHRLQ